MTVKHFIIVLTIIFGTLSLNGCGFTPMHAPHQMGTDSPLKNIDVQLVENNVISQKDTGYNLLQHLKDRLVSHNNIQTKHILKIKPKSKRRAFGLNSNDIAGRYDLNISVDYSLIDKVTGQELHKGQVNSITTFGGGVDPYSQIASEQNAIEQVTRDAADRILIRLAAYFNNPQKPKPEMIELSQDEMGKKPSITETP